MEELLETARKRLAERGYKWTEPRKEIIRTFLHEATRHVSAEEFHALLLQQKQSFGLATVYRTMEIMVETGLAHKLQFGDGCSRYEVSAGNRHLHHHLLCEACGKVTEVAMDLLEQLENRIEKEYAFSITGHHLKFFGLCSECSKPGRDG